jgi:hypothetical protein
MTNEGELKKRIKPYAGQRVNKTEDMLKLVDEAKKHLLEKSHIESANYLGKKDYIVIDYDTWRLWFGE